MLERRQIFISGLVQGVGFRPFVFRWAKQCDLRGTIQNQGFAVVADLEGESESLRRFAAGLYERAPARAVLESVSMQAKTPLGQLGLRIVESQKQSEHSVSSMLAADVATCEECEREFMDPHNRRFGYPLIGCCDCGPRLSALRGMPYDRSHTSWDAFPPCEECQLEYEQVENRRFHAQNIACHRCGPKYYLFSVHGCEEMCAADATQVFALGNRLRDELRQGRIIAMKSISGYQLIADARNQAAITKLRAKKSRPSQPFALMAAEPVTLEKQVELSRAAVSLLCSPERPIVICPRGKACDLPVEDLAPGLDRLGVMLPATPMHRLLFGALSESEWRSEFDFLVVTSGNAHGEPICATHEEAMQNLSSVADYVVSHDREIEIRSDDSVLIDHGGQLRTIRAARGLAPGLLHAPASGVMRGKKLGEPSAFVLAMGGDLKSTISFAQRGQIITTPHIGGLMEPTTFRQFRSTLNLWSALLDQQEKVRRESGRGMVVVDAHPQYLSSELGRALAREWGWGLLEVQHHHAHAASCMAEHRLEGALAVVFDGAGHGLDGQSWGGELLAASRTGFRRLGTFVAAPLLGGDASIHQPWRQFAARILNTEFKQWSVNETPPVGSEVISTLTELLSGLYPEWRPESLQQLKDVFRVRARSAPATHAAGRLFDSVAALLGCAPLTTTYEAEAPARLESMARAAFMRQARTEDSLLKTRLPVLCREDATLGLLIDPGPMLDELLARARKGHDASVLALEFHKWMAESVAQMLRYGHRVTGLEDVVFSGGVFTNGLLVDLIRSRVGGDPEIGPFLHLAFHEKVPMGDGGLSLGQAWIAAKGEGECTSFR